MNTSRPNKKISPNAYNALEDALAVIFWYKQPLERYLRRLLRDAPELLNGLDFSGAKKRDIAAQLVERLVEGEPKYQLVSLSLMLDVASQESFPDLETQEDRETKIANAKRAVAELRRWTQRYQEILDEHEKYTAEMALASEKAEKSRAFSARLRELHEQFLDMYKDTNPQARGRRFESFLKVLFGLFNMEPRAAYSLDREQIDGSLSFETDDYILEAKWWTSPVGRDQLDIFSAKVNRKGKNALGLFISVNGFTSDALGEYDHSTVFITIDGNDLYAVLDERVRLDELLRRKKRHANETGNCYFPASQMFL